MPRLAIVALLAVVGVVVTSTPVLSQNGPSAPVIRKVHVHDGVIDIQGENFGREMPHVFIGEDEIPVLSYSSTNVLSLLPVPPAAGTYRLTLTVSKHSWTWLDLTVGAAGP